MGRMKKDIMRNLTAWAAVLLGTACSTALDPAPAGGDARLRLTASIGTSATVGTRAHRLGNNDLWSNAFFEEGDAVGLFSRIGPVVNAELRFERDSDDGKGIFLQGAGEQIGTDGMKAGNTFLYFPYCKEISDPGLELRVKNGEDNTMRCLDFLVLNAPKVEDESNLSGMFEHAFSELVIMRGTGFDQPGQLASDKDPDIDYEKITVVLKAPYTHVKVNPSDYTLELGHVGDAASLADGKDARRWVAWKGENYGKTVDDKGNVTNAGVPAWYVILPTAAEKSAEKPDEVDYAEVDYVEIYDNEGNMCFISAFRLGKGDNVSGNESKELIPTWRYPVTVKMTEMVPTITPFPIIPWETEDDITNENKVGIRSEKEFEDWRMKYQAYLPDRTEGGADLAQYGDYNASTGTWEFYLETDIDLSKIAEDDSSGAIIPELQDVLNGRSGDIDGFAFQNHRFTKLDRPFVGTISGNGALENLDFAQPFVDAESILDPTGILANTISNSGGVQVINCRILSGTLVGGGPVGMIAGTMGGATIEGCTFSGLLIGSESDRESAYLCGRALGANTIKDDNDTASIGFQTKQ